MKKFVSFVKKEFYHILRDWRTMLILIGMPIAQILLFGFAISTEVHNVRVAVIDHSQDEVTRALVRKFAANKYFSVFKYLNNERDIDLTFKQNGADLVLVFENDFHKNLVKNNFASVQLITDGSDPNTALTVTNYAVGVIGSYQRQLAKSASAMQIVPEIKMLYNPQMKSAYNFVPGVMGLILMLLCAMMTSISIVREKERGTMEVLLVSPLKPIYIILAKTVPYFVLSVVNIISILLLSVYVLGVPINGSLWLLVLISLLFVFVSLALGILISSIAQTQVVAMLVSGMVLMMPVMLLSGMMFPVESLPKILQWVSSVIPARWYIVAVKKVMIEGLDIQYVIKELAILCGMAFFLITLSLKKFKFRLE